MCYNFPGIDLSIEGLSWILPPHPSTITAGKAVAGGFQVPPLPYALRTFAYSLLAQPATCTTPPTPRSPQPPPIPPYVPWSLPLPCPNPQSLPLLWVNRWRGGGGGGWGAEAAEGKWRWGQKAAVGGSHLHPVYFIYHYRTMVFSPMLIGGKILSYIQVNTLCWKTATNREKMLQRFVSWGNTLFERLKKFHPYSLQKRLIGNLTTVHKYLCWEKIQWGLLTTGTN